VVRITGLGERGLDVTKPILAVIDGSKALSCAIRDVFDKPLIHRCQQHKIRNVRDKLPGKLRTVVEHRMREAYHASSAVEAEGLPETLTILRLGVPPPWQEYSTNPIVNP
jgi:putative transposase